MTGIVHCKNSSREALADAGFKRIELGEEAPEGVPNLVKTTNTHKSSASGRAAESPTLQFELKQEREQGSPGGFVPPTLERGAPYNHASVQMA